MLTCMDDLTAPLVADPDAGGDAGGGDEPGGHPARVAARPHVVVIGATNRPDALDPALRWLHRGA
jgi:SpoVK/Ycf46/Vps4 family AAA+-type ATPase